MHHTADENFLYKTVVNIELSPTMIGVNMCPIGLYQWHFRFNIDIFIPLLIFKFKSTDTVKIADNYCCSLIKH